MFCPLHSKCRGEGLTLTSVQPLAIPHPPSPKLSSIQRYNQTNVTAQTRDGLAHWSNGKHSSRDSARVESTLEHTSNPARYGNYTFGLMESALFRSNNSSSDRSKRQSKLQQEMDLRLDRTRSHLRVSARCEAYIRPNGKTQVHIEQSIQREITTIEAPARDVSTPSIK